MSALDKILFSKIETPIEIAIYQLWRISNKPTDESDTMFVVAQNAASELARLQAIETDRDRLREKLNAVASLVNDWRFVTLEQPMPTDKALGIEQCARELAATLTGMEQETK